MSYFPHTPEALLERNDSKNAARTCSGITSTGRACRRAIALPQSPFVTDGAVFTCPLNADAYCWQHKDQATARAEQYAGQIARIKRQVAPRTANLFPLRERSSIETLVQKLGINTTNVDDARKQDRRYMNPPAPRRTTTNDFARPTQHESQAPHAEKYRSRQASSSRHTGKKKSFWASLCCMVAAEDDGEYMEVVRHRKRVHQTQRPQPQEPETSTIATRPSPTTIRQTSYPRSDSDVTTEITTLTIDEPTRLNTQTNELLSLIPPGLGATTTSALLAELVKPISLHDEEGYIYIFWLTPQSKSPPAEVTTRALLSPPDTRPQYARRISDVMTEYSFEGDDDDECPTQRQRNQCHSGGGPSRRTILLKIGRANNITRRMNEWQRQCGYALNLVRWYPYISPSSPASTPEHSPKHWSNDALYPDLTMPPAPRWRTPAVRKCPHVHRVERLIHLELASQQVKRRCEACGKEHREWFEVEATQAGVRAVDETVRRWIRWAEAPTGDRRI